MQCVRFVGVSGIVLILACSARVALGDDPTPRFVLPGLNDFWATVERPLFSRSRRPTDDTPAEKSVTGENNEISDAPGMMLVGTATDQRARAVAVLRNAADATEFRVWVGDDVGGWRVKAITRRTLVLESANATVTVTLDEPLLPEASTAP